MDRTLILVKPDAFARGLTGEIITRFERKGLRLAALKLMRVDAAMAERHYADHVGKPFFEGLIAFITSGPIVAAIFEGANAIDACRQVIGATDPLMAAPGSIRGDFATVTQRNLVHGADSEESAEREIEIYFPEQAIAMEGSAAARAS
jgi:nucleoside-diphosphate kinase